MFSGVLPLYVTQFVAAVNKELGRSQRSKALSRLQEFWIGVCLVGSLVTASLCWARIERASLGKYSVAGLSWMFRHAKIFWDRVLQSSVEVVLNHYAINSGVLDVDDTQRRRAKTTKRIPYAHRIFDTKTGGYINGQCLVLLVLVTPVITIPVGFAFYMPDPNLREWKKEEERLKKLGVPKKERPGEPIRDKRYPTKQELALRLLDNFKVSHPNVAIKAVLADALYGTREFLDGARELFGTQVISQVRKDQIVHFRTKSMTVEAYFRRCNPGVETEIKLRGHEKVTAWVSSARLYVRAHERKRFLVAIRYDGEPEPRYLIASDMSWRTIDIMQAYSLRWLIEVFIEDWKLNEGWGQLAKQTDEEGSCRGVILSLLLDHCLLLHPQQEARLKDKLPAFTVGSLRRRLSVELLVDSFRDLLLSPAPLQLLEQWQARIQEFFQLLPSTKHLSGLDIGRLEPTPSLKCRARLAAASG